MSIFISFSMYFLSFIPLWLTVLFIDMKSMLEGTENNYTEIISVIIILICTLFSLIILFAKFYFTNDERYIYTIKKAKESKTISAEFLLSYILPLFAFDFTQWDEVVKFLIFFSVFGYLCIRHNSFSVNIVLEIMHYRIYECTLLNGDNKDVEKTVISKKVLTMNKGNEIEIIILNNEFYLEVGNKR